MTLSIPDGSNYFRGLLILIRQDRTISEPEVDHLRRIGRSLGFEREFVENSIKEILDNQYVSGEPPTFSSVEIAKKFIRDGLTVAFSDREFHPDEEKWLSRAVEQNHIDQSWYLSEKQNIIEQPDRIYRLEVEDMTMG